jgi:hypothetical protein
MDIAVQIAAWPVDAPRGAVSRFCREYEVSRSWFYQVRARVAVEGVELGLQRRRRSPDRSPLAIPIEIEEIAVRLRNELAEDGCDHGPITVRDRLLKLGITAPSQSTLSRIFTRRGMVVPEPRKRPRSILSPLRGCFGAPIVAVGCFRVAAVERLAGGDLSA